MAQDRLIPPSQSRRSVGGSTSGEALTAVPRPAFALDVLASPAEDGEEDVPEARADASVDDINASAQRALEQAEARGLHDASSHSIAERDWEVYWRNFAEFEWLGDGRALHPKCGPGRLRTLSTPQIRLKITTVPTHLLVGADRSAGRRFLALLGANDVSTNVSSSAAPRG